MRRLILFRHAKAIRATPGMRDLDRPLDDRGRGDAHIIGAYLARHRFTPNRVVISPSVRTRETWDQAATSFRLPAATEDDRIYEATPEDILAVIAEVPAEVETLLLVGHNPGLHQLARILIASGDIDHRERLTEELPTSGLVVIDFAVNAWSKVHPQGGRLERFVSPRILAAATD